MVQHVWPRADVDEMTQAEFASYVAVVPRRVKTQFGYAEVMDMYARAERDAEIDRMAEYAQHWQAELRAASDGEV